MSSFALALAFAVLAAPPAAKKVVADPVCDGGTSLKTETSGYDLIKTCTRPNGEKHGPFTNVNVQTGMLQQRGSHHAGLLHGAWSTWWASGAIREQGSYHEGKARGFWTTFHENGKKHTSGEYGADGKRGTWSTWSADGKLVEEGEYRNGLKHGFWTTWDPKTGKELSSVEYANGELRKR